MRPGVVEFTAGDKVAIGRYPEGVDEFVTAVAQAWRRAGFEVTEHEQVMNTKWAKLIVNLNNATYAILDIWVQLSLADRAVREFMADVGDEGLRVLDAAGIAVEDKHNLIPIREEMRRLREGELRSLAEAESIPLGLRHYPSTWQDLALGRGATEVDLFNGEVVRLGRAHGVATPYNETLLEVMEQMTQARERPGRHTLAELKALCRRAAAGGTGR
jgi:2-dehydropantoate 2-reductase